MSNNQLYSALKRTSTLGLGAPREPVNAGSRYARLAEWILEPRAKRCV